MIARPRSSQSFAAAAALLLAAIAIGATAREAPLAADTPAAAAPADAWL